MRFRYIDQGFHGLWKLGWSGSIQDEHSKQIWNVHLDSGLVWFPQLPCTLANVFIFNLVYNKKHIKLYSKHNTKI